MIVIVITVALSATTTFMTVRQSAKRGLMQTNMDPSNPMAQSQKFMQYIVPFFSLTGLYWQYGLVLYWVTTNLWTLGQQYFMFRNWDPAAGRRRGRAGRRDHRRHGQTAQNPARPGSSGTGSSRQSSSRPASGAKTAGCGCQDGAGAKTAASGARNGTASGRHGRHAQGSAPARAKGDTASGSGSTTRDRDGADRDGVPPGDHRVPPGHRAERHGKARAAATRPGESRTRAPGRRAHR